jgi:protein TonB
MVSRGKEAFRVNYAERERNPAKHLPQIGAVIVLHIIIGWALVSGLARKVVEVMKAPIETKIIEEVKKPPPDLPPPPPPPKLQAPPPPFIPPPEIQIQQPPPPPQQTITTVTNTPPPPGPPPKIYTPPVQAPPQPAVRKEYKATFCPKPQFPRQAIQQGITGNVTVWVYVTAQGGVSDVQIKRSSNRIFDREVVRAMSQCKYAPEAVGFIGEYEIEFNLKD